VDSHFGLIVLVGVAVLMVVIGLVYLGGGAAELRRHGQLRRHGKATRGTLVSLRRRGYGSRAVVRFIAPGNRTITASSTASTSGRKLASSKTIGLGRQLVVRYLPDDPANVLVDGFDTRTQPWTYLICGVAAIVAGLLLAAISLPSLGWDFIHLS
jgi:hypothetical protein